MHALYIYILLCNWVCVCICVYYYIVMRVYRYCSIICLYRISQLSSTNDFSLTAKSSAFLLTKGNTMNRLVSFWGFGWFSKVILEMNLSIVWLIMFSGCSFFNKIILSRLTSSFLFSCIAKILQIRFKRQFISPFLYFRAARLFQFK